MAAGRLAGVANGPPMTEPTTEQTLAATAQPAMDAEDTLWSRFAASTDTAEFASLWLTLMCRQLHGARAGLVLLGATGRGPYTPVAVWPAGHSVVHLTESAQQALQQRRSLVARRVSGSGDEADGPAVRDLCYPLLPDDGIRGVVVIEVLDQPSAVLQGILRQLHWGIFALEHHLHGTDAAAATAARERVFSVLDLVAIAIEQERFYSACTTLVSELAQRLDADRVSLGFRRRGQIRVEAISHNANFGRQMNLTRLLEAAMDEAAD